MVAPTERGEDIAAVVELARRGEVVPQIDRVVGLTDVATALQDLADGLVRGKVAVQPRTPTQAVAKSYCGRMHDPRASSMVSS